MLAALILAAAAATQVPLPVIAAAPPPPIIRTSARVGRDFVVINDNSAIVIPVRVRIMAGDRQLLSDTFRVGRNSGANYEQTRSEAPAVCSEQQQHYGSQERFALRLNLTLRYDGADTTAPLVSVSVEWQRPSPGPSCAGEGSRQVQLTQTVPLAEGQSVTLQGDAGLTVTLSR